MSGGGCFAASSPTLETNIRIAAVLMQQVHHEKQTRCLFVDDPVVKHMENHQLVSTAHTSPAFSDVVKPLALLDTPTRRNC